MRELKCVSLLMLASLTCLCLAGCLILVSGVSVSPATITLLVGGTQQLTASVSPADATDQAVGWSTSDAKVTSVNATGLVTGLAVGSATITVTTADNGKTAGCRVMVTCTDACPAPNGGVTYGCRKRFMYGVNWAWKNWGADFGGISAWGVAGTSVSDDGAAFGSDLAEMKAAGASVIRWWMFPRFLTDSIQWAADDTPSRIGGSLVADIQKALELAEQNDVYLMLTPFSFDNFFPSRDEGGVWSRGIKPMIIDPAKRQKLLDILIKPVAQAVEASPYKSRMIAWDMINEPEWALTGPNPNGGEDFTPNGECETVTHAQMETFLQELAAVLRLNNPGALLTVGNAAIKWGSAWIHVDQDFYSLHYYDWVYEYYPYSSVTPESVGLTDKPVVIGEYPIGGLSAVGGNPARTAAQYSADLWDLGYGGTLAWAFNDNGFPWSAALLKPFADQRPCETAY